MVEIEKSGTAKFQRYRILQELTYISSDVSSTFQCRCKLDDTLELFTAYWTPNSQLTSLVAPVGADLSNFEWLDRRDGEEVYF